jgi:hypothetical protein
MRLLLTPDQDRMATVIFKRISRVAPLTNLMCTAKPMGRDIVVTLWLKDGENWLTRTTVEGGTSNKECHEVAVTLMDQLCLLLVRADREPTVKFDIRTNKECQDR